MTNQVPEICPKCGQNDQIFEVRLLYLETLEYVKPGTKAETPQLDRLLEISGLKEQPNSKKNRIVNEMIKSFAPPSGKPELLKSISPDLVVGAFSALAVYILYQIFKTQRPVFWITTVVFAVFIASYFLLRKKILARYQDQLDMDTSSKDVIKKAIGKWMKLSYCSRDNIVFGANKTDFVPLEEMNKYLLKNSVKKPDLIKEKS